MHHSIHGDVFAPVAPSSLAPSLALHAQATKGSTRKTSGLPVESSLKSAASSSSSTVTQKTQPKAKPKDGFTNTLLTSYQFTASKTNRRPLPSVAGVSAHLESLGIKRTPKKPKQCTERDIDHSLYLFPMYLFPLLSEGGAISECGLELKGVEHDPRSIILDLGSCFMEVRPYLRPQLHALTPIQIEPLLHTSPQIFVNDDWDQVMRVPADSRGFKVVLAFQMKSYTIALLSHDNLCYIYWYSRADIDLARTARVPGQ